ncbi:Adiponectin receptor protein [Halotydeus destructor]|nr:Adiponectin receptor protein [Halotydeus destructor]
MPPESETDNRALTGQSLKKRVRSNSNGSNDGQDTEAVTTLSPLSSNENGSLTGSEALSTMGCSHALKKLLHFHELPEWLRDNDCLHSWHRPPTPSVKECLKSIFSIHTETGNIWTHLLGTLLFVGLAIEFYTFSGRDLAGMDKAAFGIYFAAALGCLSFSTIYHTFGCHSHPVASVCKGFDYCGIAIMISGSLMSYLYYCFYCNPITKLVYLIVIPVAGCGVAAVALWPKMGSPEFRAIRATIFIGFGLSSVIPVIHLFFLAHTGVNHAALILMGALYIFGAVLYANRIPERIWPGKCDLWFQSHQIFHVCVVAAALVQYANIHEVAKLRNYGQYVCPLPSIPGLPTPAA